MKSNRMRIFTPISEFGESRVRWRFPVLSKQEVVDIEKLGAPEPIIKPEPDMIVHDILLATLRRVQKNGNSEVAEAAERYLQFLQTIS